MNEISGWLTQFFRDRTSTPLFPTFAWSWCVVNWRIIYITLFINHENIPPPFPNKIAYIENQLTLCSSLLWPFLITAFILVPGQWLANQTYSLSIHFQSQRLALKNKKINSNRMFTQNQVNEKMRVQQEINDRQAATIAEYSKTVEQAQANYNNLSSSNLAFKVINAQYGSVNRFADVTRQIAALGANEGQITVGNIELGGDPYPGFVKTLIVYYRNNGKDETVICLEGDTLMFTKGNAKVDDGEQSKNMKADLERSLKAIEEQKTENEKSI
jgi:hypothetical protein